MKYLTETLLPREFFWSHKPVASQKEFPTALLNLIEGRFTCKVEKNSTTNEKEKVLN